MTDAFITLLAGAQGLVEVYKRLKADLGLQRAFGSRGCAEQSVVQDTLDACTACNAQQIGWVRAPMDMYGRPVSRIAVRFRKKNGP